MDVIIIFNGLGNQMSQYSFYKQKKQIHKSTYFIPFCKDHNGLELEKVFNIDCKERLVQKLLYFLFRLLLTDKVGFITKPIQKLLGLIKCKIVKDNFNYNFDEKFLIKAKGITFYYGGWHSELFFNNIKDELKVDFQFEEPIDIENKNLKEVISLTNSVSIHVRRGDFLNAENINLFGDVCSKAYFEKAIELMSREIDNPHFFIFSNDMEWVKDNIYIDNVTYVTCNIGVDSWKDMYLMSLCKHNIVANSTFSWWGAWLNKNKNKIVISPSRFLKNDNQTDVYPDSWVKLADY